MTISSANMVYEMRANGSADNGGGFLNGGTGTDYSQQDAAQVTYTDLVIDATTNTDVTSAATPFTSAHVGNVINITGGTGFTVGRYEVISVAGVIATLSSAVGTTSSTGGAGKLGGAIFLWTDVFFEGLTAGNLIWVKADGTHTFTEGLSVSKDGTSDAYLQVLGYKTTRGDADLIESNRPDLSLGAYFFDTDNYWEIRNLYTLGTGAINLGMDSYGIIKNCKCVNTSGTSGRSAISIDASAEAIECESSSSNGMCFFLGASSKANYCHAYGSTHAGWGGFVASGNGCTLQNCISSNNYNGIRALSSAILAAHKTTVYNCTIGVYVASAADKLVLTDTIIDNCTTGLERQTAITNLSADILENINFSNNTTDKTNVGTIINETNLDPQFVNAAAGDFETGSNMEMTYTWPAGLTSTTIKNGAVQDVGAGGGGTDKIGKLVGFGGGLV